MNIRLRYYINKSIVTLSIIVLITTHILGPSSVKALGNFDLISSVITTPVNEYKVDIASGVAEKHYSFEDKQGKRVESFVVEMDMENDSVAIEAGTPNDADTYGLQSVRQQANAASSASHKVVAAVNADFYNMATGEPSGIIYKDGRAIKSDLRSDWNFFGITKDGSAVIGDSQSYNNVKDSLKEALGGNAILVKGGQAFQTPTTGADREPRTAVGIKANGNVFFTQIDGRQEPYSAGISMGELAELMIDLGAITALNLDGGGSSALLSRKAGGDDLQLISSPSDGGERSVANSWLIVSTAESNHEFNSAFIKPYDKSFTPGSTVQFSSEGRDAALASAPMPTSGLSWDLSDSTFGKIDTNGEFISSDKTGQFEVLLKQDGNVVGRSWVESENPDEIYFGSSGLTLAKNSEKSLGLITRFNKRSVKWKPEDVEWQIPEGIGTVDENGTIHTLGSSISGKIVAKLKNTSLSAEINVTVGQLPETIFGFENDLGSWKASVVGRGEVGLVGLSTYPMEPVRFGDNSLKVNFDFTNAQKQTTLGVYVGPGINTPIPGVPTAIGMWIYATPEAQKYWLRMSIVDAANKTQAINLTDDVVGVNWTGWKYVEAAIPSTYIGPFMMHSTQSIRIMSTKSGITGPMTKGSIYVDNIRAVYGDKVDDLYPPVIESVNVDEKVYTNNSININAQLHEYENDPFKTGINWNRVRILVDGVDYTAKKDNFSYDMDGTVSLSGLKWADGIHAAEVIAQDNFGNETTKTAYFTVDTGNTKVELNCTADSIILGDTYQLKIDTNNSSDVKAATIRVYTGKDFPVKDVQFNEAAVGSTYKYDADTGIVTLSIINNSTDKVANLATINVSVPSATKNGTELSYNIVDSSIQYVDVVDSTFINTFYSRPVSIPVIGAYNVDVKPLMVGKPGIILITDNNSKPATGVNVKMQLADGTEKLLGQTDANGQVESELITDYVKKLNIYAQKDGLYSFKVSTQSYIPLKDAKPSNIMLGATEDPTRQQSFTWMSNPLTSKDSALLQYAVKSKYETKGDSAFKTVKGKYADKVFSGSQDITQNGIARLNYITASKLKAGTTYVYKVGDSENWSEVKEFTTESNKGAFDFVVFGDTQSQTVEGLSELDTIITNIENEPIKPSFIAHVGDFIDDASIFSQWDAITSMIDKHPKFDSIDMVHVLGNHEYMGDTTGEIAKTIFNNPQNGPKGNVGGVYSTDYNNVHVSVISFTSDKDLLQKELDWLRKDVKKSHKQWNIVLTHQPPYYTNPLGGNELFREMLPPVMDELGIDLVFSGHDHAYGRTKQLIGGVETKGGTTYLVTGTTGKKHYDAVNDGSFVTYNSDSAAMYLTASVNKGVMNIITKKTDGTIVDQFTLEK